MNNLKKLRQKKGVTQIDVAKIIGVSKSTYSYWEMDKYQPDNESLFKLADYFGVSIDYLLGRDNSDNSLEIDDFTYALYNETKELTEEDKKQLIAMARFLKSQKDN